MTSPSITDWIGAISTAVLGGTGILITVWQMHLTKFNPQLTSRIDKQREAIELLVVNKGRASGIIDRVSVARPAPDNKSTLIVDTEAKFEGFTENAFRPLVLPAMASIRIMIQAPAERPFAAGVKLLVGVGKAQPELVTPTEPASELSLFGIRSVLPPGTPT
jgi:hypothetical protein